MTERGGCYIFQQVLSTLLILLIQKMSYMHLVYNDMWMTVYKLRDQRSCVNIIEGIIYDENTLKIYKPTT